MKTRRITRKWKLMLKKGLLVFTTDPKSPTHQKRLIRGEKDFASGIVSGLSEKEALEKAFKNAAGGTNAKYNAALAAAYKASPAKRFSNNLKTAGNGARAIANKATTHSKSYFGKLWASTKEATRNYGWALLIAAVIVILSFWLSNPSVWLGLAFWLLTAAAVILVVLLHPGKWFRRLVFAAVIVAIVIGCSAVFGGVSTPKETTPTTTVPTASPTTLVAIPTTWLMVTSDYGNNRWFADGITEIRNAKTDAEATDAAYVWLERVKTDPNLLVGAAKYLLDQDIDKATLVTTDGWATDKAVQLVTELQLLLGKATIVAENAPANGYNSGVNNNTVVAAEVSGIKGNTAAVKITTADGSVYWVMARCGNIVTPGKPNVPPGKTDETPTPTPTPTPTLTPKSTNPADYKQPGDGTEKDSGTGTKPSEPTVAATAESTPPFVATTTQPGLVLVAPGATTIPAQTASPAVPTPAPEAGVNPTTGVNTGDPSVPAGW